MDFKLEEIKKDNKKIYNYDINKLIKKSNITFPEAKFVLDTLCHEISQEKFDFFVLTIGHMKDNVVLEKTNNYFRIKTPLKMNKTKQMVGAFMHYKEEILILGQTINLSNMLRELFLKLRYMNQDRRMSFIKQNPELSKNNEQIYLIYKENEIKEKDKKFYNKYKNYFEENIDAEEVSLKQMIGICERFEINNKLLKDMKKELVIVQNRRKKKEYETVKNKTNNIVEYIDFGEI